MFFKVPFNETVFAKYSILDISVFAKGIMFSKFFQLTNILKPVFVVGGMHDKYF